MELITCHIKHVGKRSEPLVIAPLGDIQWAGKNGPTAKDTLKEYLDRTMEMGAWYVGMGDYIDFLSPSNRQRLKAAALYDTAEDVIDDKAMELVHELYQGYLKPTRGRWLGMLHGHHYSMLKTGETTDQRLCQLLDTRFLGTSAFIRLQFGFWGSRYNVVLWAHHGCGGGMTAGAPLNKLQQAALGFDADIYIMGHTTKQPAVPLNRIKARWHGKGAPDLLHKKVLLVNSGGFAKGYVTRSKQGQVPMGGYVEQRMLNPAALGAPVIRIQPDVLDKGDYNTAKNPRRREWSPRISVEI